MNKEIKITPQEICKAINQLLGENKELKEENETLKEMQCTFLGTGCKKKINELNELKEWLEEQSSKVDDFFTVVRLSDIKAKIEELEGENKNG